MEITLTITGSSSEEIRTAMLGLLKQPEVIAVSQETTLEAAPVKPFKGKVKDAEVVQLPKKEEAAAPEKEEAPFQSAPEKTNEGQVTLKDVTDFVMAQPDAFKQESLKPLLEKWKIKRLSDVPVEKLEELLGLLKLEAL